ncbi:MAG TPA: leucine-rich repeat protein, partial [Draconibacterium sp.]|nr:leucine-rich repeat protein [Draconibacterium sp.]
MKTSFLFLMALCLTIILQAQVSKTVNVTAGSLTTLLTAEELSSITYLIITGTIDARDFKTMRDSMPLLSEIDLSNVTVTSYVGTEGTGGEYETNYLANEIPFAAFVDVITEIGKTSLNSIMLPINITSIGTGAFYNCSGLKSISIPAS